MYTKMDNSGVEDICYDETHIGKVLEAIKASFPPYFLRFIESHAGKNITESDVAKLREKFGAGAIKSKKAINTSSIYKEIIADAINDFEKDRHDYEKIFDEEILEDFDEDAYTFKSKVLKNECPIIRKTIANKRAKELDKYRAAFSMADPEDLLAVVTNLCRFSNDYVREYKEDAYEAIQNYHDMGLEILDTDDYTAYGVIGGGIKTHMLYKVHPCQFPSRSRNALWALWYLSGKKKFDCKTDSEFLMIDVGKSITQQNYFYPYQLFAYYAFELYKMLKEKAIENDVYIDTQYRYVIVGAFLDYVALEHESEISILKSQIRDGGLGYA